MAGRVFVPIRHEPLWTTGKLHNVYGAILVGEGISVLPTITLSIERLAEYYGDRIGNQGILSYTPPINVFSERGETRILHYRVHSLSAEEIFRFEKVLAKLSSKPIPSKAL